MKSDGLLLGWRLILVAGLALLAALKAEKLRAAESSPEAIAEFANAAKIQNEKEFELAAIEWENFVSTYPDDPLLPKARHYLGVCRLQLMEYQAAADAFSAVIGVPDFPLLEDALLNLGWCQHLLGKAGDRAMHEAAVKTLADLNGKFPAGKFVDQSLYFQAESHYALTRLKEATQAYYELIKNHPKSSLRPDAMYAYGVALEEQGQHKIAASVYDRFLKDYPDHKLGIEVGMRKAEAILQQGDAAAAEKLFAKAAASEGFSLADHAKMRQAFCLVEQEKFKPAAELYAAVAQKPDSPQAAEAILSAGRSFYRAGELDQAATWFAKAVSAGGADATESAHWLCRIYLAQKQSAKAVEAAKATLPNASGDYLVSLKMDLADALYETPSERSAAVDQYLAIVTDHADREQAPQALYNAAFGALELKQFDKGRELAAKFLEQYASHTLLPDVKYVLAECDLQSGRLSEAETAYRSLVASHPQHAELSRWKARLGLALYAQKKYQEAADSLADLLTGDDSKITEALFISGASRFHQGDADQAQALLERALAAAPGFRQADEATLLLSRCAHKKGETEKAIGLAKFIIAEYPQSRLLDQAHYRLGEYLYGDGDFAAAAKEYSQSATAWPDSSLAPFALYGLGWSLLKQRDHAAAAEQFTALITKHPQSSVAADALIARATCRRLLGDFAGAAADITERLKLTLTAEQKSGALYEKGLAEAGLRDFAAAAATFASLLAENPSYASADKVLYEQGWAFKSLDKNAESLAAFARLTELFPNSPLAAESLFHVAESHYEKADYAGALAAYEAVVEKATSAGQADPELAEKAVHKMGWANFQGKQYQPALEQFDRQIRDWPSGPLAADAQFMRAECLFKQEKYEPAMAAFDALGQAKLSSEALGDLASLHAGQCAAQLGQWPASVARLTKFLEERAASPYAAEALYEIGYGQTKLDESEKALKSFEQAAAKELSLRKGRGSISARAYFLAGELHFQHKRFKEAILQFQRVMYGKFVDEVALWREKSAYEAGRCAEVQIQGASGSEERAARVADARKSYEWLVKNFPESELAAEGKRRLAELATAGAP